MAMSGTHDARGFRQWEKVGRKIKKGTRAFHILGPCIGKRPKKDNEENDTEKTFLFGFRSIPAFAIENTEIADPEKWDKAEKVDKRELGRIKDLPLIEIAEHWGLTVTSYNGKNRECLGRYVHNKGIALGVENLSTWAHELIHAADDKNGTIKKSYMQENSNEMVAELGGATLLTIMGYKADADLGGAWDYIQSYSYGDHDKKISCCMSLLKRICECIDLIINTADQLNLSKAA